MFLLSVFGFLQTQKHLLLGLCAASFVIALGYHVPVTGFLLNGLTDNAQSQLASIHIFSVGFSGWSISWALFQVFALIRQKSASATSTTVQVVNPFDIKIFVITLIISSLEWFGVLSGTVPMFTQNAASTSQLLIGITTGLAGVSILFLLGLWIERLTPRFGFWALIALLNLYGFGSSVAFGIEMLVTSGISRNLAIFSLVLLLLSIFSAVFLVHDQQENVPENPPAVFSILLLSSVFMPWLTSFIYLALEPILPLFAEDLPEFAMRNFYIFTILVVQIVFIFIFNWLFILRKSGVMSLLKVPALLAILLVASELNFVFGGLQWSRVSAMTLLIVAWAAWEILKAYRNYRGPIVVETKDDFDDDFRRGWRNPS
jgi:hypothetical protein